MSLGCIHSLASPARAVRVLVVCSALAACAKGPTEGADNFLGDGSFGALGEPVTEDAAAEDDARAEENDSGLSGEFVRLRVFHGVPNLPAASFCHDPDLAVDDPRTRGDEGDGGPMPAQLLSLGDAGVVSFAETTAYVTLPAMIRGAITVHRVPLMQASLDAGSPDAGLDAGLDGGTDAGGTLDAGGDAASLDAGGPCDPRTLEAVLPLPMTSAWLWPERGVDASVDPEQGGFVVTASDGDTLTLFGSGFALDPVELARRGEAARQSYLMTDAGDLLGAEAEARQQVLSLQAAYAARFLLSRGLRPDARRFALSLAHLVPDVPATTPGRPTQPGSGALRLCVTIDQKESDPTDGGVARFEFRNVTPIASNLDPGLHYRFRVFVEADYQGGSNSCVTTSLKPVAQLEVDAGTFEADRSYTLVTWGAYDPASACTSTNTSSLIKQGCARAVDALGARIDIVPNELPSP